MALAPKKLVGNVATVFNGYGRVAFSLIPRLKTTGAQIVSAYRGAIYNNEKLKGGSNLGQLFFSHYHLKDDDSLRAAMQHSNIVINLIGKMNETKNFSFEEVHIEGPRRMARIARQLGVEKFIHISALNCSPNPTPMVLKNGSKFLRTKYLGELAVRDEFPEAIIFRPSDIAGERDDFIVHWTSVYRSRFTNKCPIWDYYDGVEKQPVYVGDLVSGIEAAILNDSANGKTFQAYGPHRYRFYDLIEYIRACGGQGPNDECRITNLRWDFLRFYISFLERIQKYPFLTWERIERDLHSDKIDPKMPSLVDLGVQLSPLERFIAIMAHYRPREHRYEMLYNEREPVKWPLRLDEAVA